MPHSGIAHRVLGLLAGKFLHGRPKPPSWNLPAPAVPGTILATREAGTLCPQVPCTTKVYSCRTGCSVNAIVLVCQPEGLDSSPQLCPGDLVKMMVS